MHNRKRGWVGILTTAALFLAAVVIPSVPAAAADAVTFLPQYVDFGRVPLGESSAARVVSVTAGSAAVTFGQVATMVGGDTGAFAITGDTCSGHTVVAGGTCAVTFVATPEHEGHANVNVAFPNANTADVYYAVLTAEAYVTRSGTYFPLQAERILDTRLGQGAPKGAVKAGGVVHLQVIGGRVPTAATAVVLNVTVTGPTAPGFVSVYPTGKPRPTVSSLNFPKGWTGANSVTVALGDGGKIDLYNNSGTTQLIVDVVGYYAGESGDNDGYRVGGEYQPFDPVRLLDTRKAGGKLTGGYMMTIPVDFGTVSTRVRAIAVNVTATGTEKAGFFTIWDGNGNVPTVSTLNYAATQTVSNFAVVPVTSCWLCPTDAKDMREFAVYTSSTAHVVIDIFGFYDDSTLGDGLRFRPLSPVRIADSRSGLGVPQAWGAGTTQAVTAPADIAGADILALALNVTAITPTKSTYLTVWPSGVSGVGKPGVSNVNAATGTVVPNAVQTLIGPSQAFNVYNLTGTTNVCVDVVGSFYYYPYQKGFGDIFLRRSTSEGFVPGSYAPAPNQPAPVRNPAR